MTAGSVAVPSIVPLRPPITGKSKNEIDTNTPVELKTETPNAEIYFTVDGSKPDPFAPLGVEKNTIKYSKPFKLREGKRTVKAMAISKDGTRESFIVTKPFDVKKSDVNEQENTGNHMHEYAFIDELERERKRDLAHKKGILKKIHDISNTSQRTASRQTDTHRSGSLDNLDSPRYMKETRFMSKRFNMNHLSNEDLSKVSAPSRYTLPDSSSQALRLQRETDFLKCIYCFAQRPHDPFARFCNECGKPLPQIPQNKLPPPEHGQMGTCNYCKSFVPLNTRICVICESPMGPQLQPQASIRLQGKITCQTCTTQNPSNYSTCVACDSKLPTNSKVMPVSLQSSQPHAQMPNKTSICSQCYRLNSPDARFCDWCGAKPERKLDTCACARCGSSNHSYAKYCITCGSIITAPHQSYTNQFSPPTWLAGLDTKSLSSLSKKYETASTQTYGLFCPRNTDKKEPDTKQVSSEKRPLLTAISAGRGYWRQQMDHICAHLKAYAQNNAEFRALVGEPRLGKINIAKVDVDSTWCTVTATFPIRNNANKDNFMSNSLIEHNLSLHSRINTIDYDALAATYGMDNGRHHTSSSGFTTSDSDSFDSKPSVIKSSAKAQKKKRENHEGSKLTGEDRQLIRELSKSGRGRVEEVKQLLNEGANPNALTKDGLTILHLTIRNKHLDCLSVLLNTNVNVEAKVPPRGNTALHEAVMLGTECEKYLKMLLEHGAQPNIKNSKGETAFDLAIKEQNALAINCLGQYTGDEMLKMYQKTKPNGIKP